MHSKNPFYNKKKYLNELQLWNEKILTCAIDILLAILRSSSIYFQCLEFISIIFNADEIYSLSQLHSYLTWSCKLKKKKIVFEKGFESESGYNTILWKTDFKVLKIEC